MHQGLFLTDFHVHLRGTSNELPNFCHEDQQAPIFKRTTKLFELVSSFSETLHGVPIRHLLTHHRGAFHRQLYSGLGQVLLMEAIRLFRCNDVAKLLVNMDRCGIDRAIVVSLEPFISTQEILDAVVGLEDRISVFASVARNQMEPAQYFQNLVDSGRISGLKIHPIVGGYACNEIYHATKDYVSIAVDKEMPILIHSGHIPKAAVRALTAGCDDVRSLEPLIRAFPKGRFILAHIGWESWRQVLEMAQRYPQIMVETSWQAPRVIRRAVDLLGPERVLFGSDFPLGTQELSLKLLKQALTPRELVMVAATNALHLIPHKQNSANHNRASNSTSTSSQS